MTNNELLNSIIQTAADLLKLDDAGKLTEEDNAELKRVEDELDSIHFLHEG